MSFPPTLFINLNKDTERMKTLLEDFKFAGWPVPLERVEAVERKPGYIGCTLSHMKCMELALERGYDWFLILEDDCLLKPRARDRFMALLPELWATRDSWDVYSAGPHRINSKIKPILINKKLGIINFSGDSSHFVLIHKEACRKILKGLKSLGETLPTIDGYYTHETKFITSVPYIAIQRPGISNIQGENNTKYEDHTETFNKTEQKLLALL